MARPGSHEPVQETNPLKENQLCIGMKDFVGQEEGDLPFRVGEKIRIVQPCNLMFWYIAQNENGKFGMVPRNFLRPIEEGYLHVNSKQMEKAKKLEMEMKALQEKERHRRLPPGTLVVGTHPFEGQQKTDLSFGVYEEMTILNPLPDLGWYYAQKTDQPSKKGSIPITNVRLVYMSDDEDENEQTDTNHDMMYDDKDDFISQSGWFSFPGLPHCKEALYKVLAKKCKIKYDDFMSCKEAVYYLDYVNGEKKFVGMAHVLHEELANHFDQFGKWKEGLREIDDELCHHTSMAGWNLSVWPLQDGQDLEVECGKKIIELDALVSKDGTGITQQLDFTSNASFEEFWKWFSPPT